MKFSIDELLNADYGKIYRSLALKNEESEENYKRFTNVEKYIYDNDGIINQEEYENYIQPKMSDILFNENSAQYLWLFRCTKSNKSNLLSDMFSYIGESSEIKRGGLNIYKRLGWDIHVLYVYQLINRNLAQNIKTEFENTNKIIEKYNTMYNDLSVDAKFILKIGTLLHDIGVIDGVADHEVKGVKWTQRRYNELKISYKELKENGIKLKEQEIIELLKLVIGMHPLINRIGSEMSDEFAIQTIKDAKGKIVKYEYANTIFNESFSQIMFLLSFADLLAVRDELLTNIKIEESINSYLYLKKMTSEKYELRDNFKWGIQRYRSYIADSLKEKFEDNEFSNEIFKLGYDPKRIAVFLYDIKLMCYAITTFKPQKDAKTGLKLICVLYDFFVINNINPKETTIKFNPDIDFVDLEEHLINNSIEDIKRKDDLKIELNNNDVMVSF
ncbi:MAG TPA: hypothetical protein DEP51_05830 [Clostridiales bacterium]|nr:hypothetical protein [Clostridiales bacterium]